MSQESNTTDRQQLLDAIYEELNLQTVLEILSQTNGGKNFVDVQIHTVEDHADGYKVKINITKKAKKIF